MSTHAYAGDEFWRGIEWLGFGPPAHGFAVRKLQMVYINWLVLLVFAVAATWAVVALIRRRRQLRQVIPFWTIALLLIYCLVAGPWWFNTRGFYHGMIDWPLSKRLLSMVRSMGIAAIPVVGLYLGQPSVSARSMTGRDRVVLHLAIFPIVHSLLTPVYLLNQNFVVE